MSGNINSGLAGVLKQLYPSNTVESSIYSKFPFLRMVKKNEKFGGDVIKVPVLRNPGANASRTASTAFANTNIATNQAFLVTRGHDYTVAYIPREDWRASLVGGSKAAFVNVAKQAVDTQMTEMTRRVARDLFRSGSGSIGQVGTSGISTTTLTLADARDTRHFEVGQEIACSSADGTGSLRDSGNTATVTAVNRSSGVITTDSNWASQISGITDDDYLFVAGDHDNPTTGTLGIKGLAAWLPTTAPSSGESFFGVDRSADPSRMAGVRVTASGDLKEELIDACTSLSLETDGQPDVIVVNPNQWATLAKLLDADRVYGKDKMGEWSYSSLKLHTPHGTVDIIGDAYCPNARAYLLTMNTWELASLDAAPHIFTEGNQYHVASTADAYSVRIGYYANLVCYNPGQNAVVTIS